MFPRRFVLPLNVNCDTAYKQNLNTRHSSTATAIRTGRNTVSVGTGAGSSRARQPSCLARQVCCTHQDLHGEDLHRYGGLEFPQINYGSYNARPYRYFYGCGFRHLVGDSLIKMDVSSKSMKVTFQLLLSFKIHLSCYFLSRCGNKLGSIPPSPSLSPPPTPPKRTTAPSSPW